ncbi:MAG: hypothetical protein E7638_05410 [Ruminococcaceae bacterium]|nr:hypothetical protein [Oscillospiraceae bacterium]
MAKNKNNKQDGKVTAGELFDKLKVKNAAEKTASEGKPTGNGFSIDATSGRQSDSELDINELLKKYMPEYEDEGGEEKSAEGGVISNLKNAESAEVGETDDERLISALDSAFGPADGDMDGVFEAAEEAVSEDDTDSYAAVFAEEEKGTGRRKKEKKEKRRFSLFGRKKAEDEADAFGLPMESALSAETDEGDAAPAEEENDIAFAEKLFDSPAEAAAEVSSEAADAVIRSAMPEAADLKEADSDTTDIRLGDIAELENILNDSEPINKVTPGPRPKGEEDDLLKKLEALELEEAEPSAAFEVKPSAEEAAEAEVPEVYELPVDEEGNVPDSAGSEEQLSEETATEEIDPTDLNLRVAFGLDEDDKKADAGAAKEFGDRLEEKQYKREKRVKLDRPEFVDKTQIPKLRKEYKNRLIGLWIKLGLAVIFAAVLMWFENITFFTELFTGEAKQFAGAFDPAVYPVVYVMVSLQLMLLSCICAYEQIIDGFKYIFRGIPRGESILSFMMTASVIYSAVLARVIDPPAEPVMFNFVVALAAVLTLVYAIYNTKREKMNFEIVSAKKTKHIVRRLPDEEAMCETQAFMEQTDVCDVMKIEKTDFIDGFFGRIYKPDSTVTVFTTFLMGIAAALAVLAGFFLNLRGGNAAEVMSAGFVALLVGAPLSVFITFSYPFYRATTAAKEYDSAIIGEASLSEYSNASIISFDDKNVFPSYSVKIQNIKIYNNARVDRVLYYAASVFAYAGGPLQDVFEVATLEMGHSEDVKIFDTEAGFLATQVNGVNIIFGNYRTLTAKGFEIPEEYASDDVDFSSELSIMYMFREDKLVAKMYIKYVMDGDIDLILKQFQGTGLYVCVRTFDPNIDERMIAKKLNMRKIPLKVVRYANADEVTMYEEKVDSGLVTSASPKSLLQIIAYCDKVLHTRKANIALSVLSVIIGVAIMGLMILSDTMGVVNSLFVALYHLIWMIPMVISAKMFIR